jgi:hypothetical protein
MKRVYRGENADLKGRSRFRLASTPSAPAQGLLYAEGSDVEGRRAKGGLRQDLPLIRECIDAEVRPRRQLKAGIRTDLAAASCRTLAGPACTAASGARSSTAGERQGVLTRHRHARFCSTASCRVPTTGGRHFDSWSPRRASPILASEAGPSGGWDRPPARVVREAQCLERGQGVMRRQQSPTSRLGAWGLRSGPLRRRHIYGDNSLKSKKSVAVANRMIMRSRGRVAPTRPLRLRRHPVAALEARAGESAGRPSAPRNAASTLERGLGAHRAAEGPGTRA